MIPFLCLPSLSAWVPSPVVLFGYLLKFFLSFFSLSSKKKFTYIVEFGMDPHQIGPSIDQSTNRGALLATSAHGVLHGLVQGMCNTLFIYQDRKEGVCCVSVRCDVAHNCFLRCNKQRRLCLLCRQWIGDARKTRNVEEEEVREMRCVFRRSYLNCSQVLSFSNDQLRNCQGHKRLLLM